MLVMEVVNLCYFCFYKLTRQEAAGALWNLSFDDRNREAIALAGGVEALVFFYHLLNSFYIYNISFCLYVSHF